MARRLNVGRASIAAAGARASVRVAAARGNSRERGGPAEPFVMTPPARRTPSS
jgi:hypothetical protein